jgi:hypothetical protein
MVYSISIIVNVNGLSLLTKFVSIFAKRFCRPVNVVGKWQNTGILAKTMFCMLKQKNLPKNSERLESKREKKMETAIAKREQQQLIAQRPSILEIKDLASVFYASGMFTDVKSEAQAMVKILAGQSFGFDAITSMAYVHIIQGKAYLGAKIQASIIKSSGMYDYKIVEHTDTACSLQFYRLFNGEWKPLNQPIRYTMQEATNAGVTSNPTWKKHPKAMLFASCIRQGMTRCTPDLLKRGQTQTFTEVEVPELAFLDSADQAIESAVVEPTVNEVVGGKFTIEDDIIDGEEV